MGLTELQDELSVGRRSNQQPGNKNARFTLVDWVPGRARKEAAGCSQAAGPGARAAVRRTVSGPLSVTSQDQKDNELEATETG